MKINRWISYYCAICTTRTCKRDDKLCSGCKKEYKLSDDKETWPAWVQGAAQMSDQDFYQRRNDAPRELPLYHADNITSEPKSQGHPWLYRGEAES